MRSRSLAIVLATGLALALGAPAAPARAAEDGGFGSFCQTWMGKLQKRERDNIARMKIRRAAEGVVGEYTGYARKPTRCKPTSKVVPGKPAVGTLVYHEIRYAKRGADQKAARAATPRAVNTVEVMEIFRYDGKRWIY